MASMMGLPHESHLSAVFQMSSFLKRKLNGVAAFDPTAPEIYKNQFPTENWSATTYSPCREDVTSNAPAHRGVGFTLRTFLTLIMLVTRSFVYQELALSCSSIVLLSLFVLRKRRSLRHRVLVLIS